MDSLKDILNKKELEKGKKFVTLEFQEFGVRIADVLHDQAHKALYIKMAKEKDRKILVHALRYVQDYPHAQKPAKIFMWKVKQLEIDEKKESQNG